MAGSRMNQLDHMSIYLRTVYWVETPERYVPLRIGREHPEWDEFLTAQNVTEWVFITACNPRSEQAVPEVNRGRMQELLNELADRSHWPGLGVGPDGDWFPEFSVCVALSATEGLALARKYDQLAIVAGKIGGEARLMWVTET